MDDMWGAHLRKQAKFRRKKYNDYWRETRRLSHKYLNTRISRVKRDEFVKLVAGVLEYNPNWIGSTLMAVNSGLIRALDRDADTIGHLVDALRWFIENTPGDTLKENRKDVGDGMKALIEMYPNSPMADDLAEIFGWNPDNWEWDVDNRQER